MWQEPAALRDFGAANDLLWVKGGEDSQGRSSPKCPDYSESEPTWGRGGERPCVP